MPVLHSDWQGLAQVLLGGLHVAETVLAGIETEFPDQQCTAKIQLHMVRARQWIITSL